MGHLLYLQKCSYSLSFYLLWSLVLCSINALSQTPTYDWSSFIKQPAVPAHPGDRSQYDDVVEDQFGNVIVSGGYLGTMEFGEGAALVTRTSGAKPNQQFKDILILKYDAAGNLLWDITLGDNPDDNIAKSLDVDWEGNIYVTGKFEGTIDFDPGSGIQNLTATSVDGDLFLAKYDPNGNYLWAFVIQGTTNFRQSGHEIKVNDAAQALIIAARLDDPIDLAPFDSSINIPVSTAGEDGAVLVYDLSGHYLFSQNYYDTSGGGYTAVHMEDDGDCFVLLAVFNGVEDIDPGVGIVPIVDPDVSVIIKYDIAGNLLWHQTLNIGNDFIKPSGIEVDPCGDIIIAGTTRDDRSFVIKCDSTGIFQWEQFSINSDQGRTYTGGGYVNGLNNGGLAVDKNSNIYLLGTSDADTLSFGSLSVQNNNRNGYIVKFDPAGTPLWLEGIIATGPHFPYNWGTNIFVSEENSLSLCTYAGDPLDIPFGGGLNGPDSYNSSVIHFLQDSSSVNLYCADCAGVPNGNSVIDACGVCLLPSDPDFNQSCADCAGVPNGNSVIDDCGVCLLPSDPDFNQSCADCTGVPNGNSVIDDCGVCLLPSDPDFNQSCADCAGVPNGNSVIDDCGVCLLPSDPDFNQSCADCAGVSNGNSVIDDCGVCLLPSDSDFNQSCADCAGVSNGNSVIDDCGVCLLPSDPDFNQSCAINNKVYIPNVFSPNGDGFNDVFQIFKAADNEAHIRRYLMFSTWGELLYEANHFSFGPSRHWWDGMFKGQIMQSRIYLYYIEVEFPDGEIKKYRGDVLLLAR